MSLNSEPVDRILFLDRDGTLIEEPSDHQIDSIEKFSLLPGVIPSLLKLKAAGYRMVMVSNQDGLGTSAYPQKVFDPIQRLLLQVFESQGISFERILICPHLARENCSCRKPATALVREYLQLSNWNRSKSYVIGDRDTDLELAKNMGVQGIRIGPELPWQETARLILLQGRQASVSRATLETQIQINLKLDSPMQPKISTGIPFFDHMIAQIAVHSGAQIELSCKGDLEIEAHHTIEDVALTLGEAWKQALGPRRNIARFAFSLPMDEAQAQVDLDLGGRPYFLWEGKMDRPDIQGFPTEMTEHFFRSFATGLEAALHLKVKGENAHHMIEACFKAMGRTLGQASALRADQIVSSKGSL